MKVIFLDIDGVLTSARSHEAFYPKHLKGLVWHHFDPVVIGFFNRLIEENDDLVFVLSSSWRKHYDKRTMTIFLAQAGWLGDWHQNWKTTDLVSYENRGKEIDVWVTEHKPDRYVIIDDQYNGWLDHQLPHFVKTDEQDGMNSITHFEAVRKALKRKIG